jgi:hypothetical protein
LFAASRQTPIGFPCSLANALDDLRRPRSVRLVTLRGTLLWVLMNALVVVGVAIGCVAWLVIAQRGNQFTGAAASGRGGLISIELPLVLVFGALLIANLAWFVFVVRKRSP